MAENVCLYLNQRQQEPPSGMRWKDDDCDVRDGSPECPVIRRIYKMGYMPPSGCTWF
jgi:hypothetical protein